jgi:hypothetical protein
MKLHRAFAVAMSLPEYKSLSSDDRPPRGRDKLRILLPHILPHQHLGKFPSRRVWMALTQFVAAQDDGELGFVCAHG